MNSNAELYPLYSTNIDVRIGDINYGGHMGNDRYLLLFHEARLRFLRSIGCSEADIGEGVSLIMSEAHINYWGEVVYGDVLTVEVGIEELKSVRFTVAFTVRKKVDGAEADTAELKKEGRSLRPRPDTGRAVAGGYTVMAGFDYAAKKLAKIPESFKTKIRALQTDLGG
jgi:acyl-CoA thioesterase FadM